MHRQVKLIAHRGACLEAQEDTLAALQLASDLGAWAVECDPRLTRDGVPVIFHDNDLKRLAGTDEKVSDLTLKEMKEALADAGKTLTTLEDLRTGYRGSAPVLFDISFDASDGALMRLLAEMPFPSIAGIHELCEVQTALSFYAPERVLAFMASPKAFDDFAAAEVGNLRLWEQWLPDLSIEEAHRRAPGRDIWIMSCDPAIDHPLFSMNSSPAQLEALCAQGADGILLNDIRMALAHRR